jgi:uncharacterized protein (TIGR00369 family)
MARIPQSDSGKTPLQKRMGNNPANGDDKELFSAISEIFNQKIPFNKMLGLKVKTISYDRVKILFEMRENLIGNYMRKTLHGGVISSAIDVTGGLAAFMGIQQKISDETLETKLAKFGRLGTIDLRVDYLRPGQGRRFISEGYSLRIGNRVAVARIEINNDQNELIAVGTGSYVVS